MIDEIRTERLLLSGPRPEDLDDYVRMHQDARVMATLGDVRSAGEIKAWFERKPIEWAEIGFSWWIVRLLETGQFAGRGGLRQVELEGQNVVEVGYGFLPEFWGRGFATELARESVRVGFEELKLPELVSFTLPTNVASRRVMEKAGFVYERDCVYADMPHVLYRQNRKRN